MSCRETGERYVEELLRSGRCTIAEVAGSLRRGRESEHDVDIVCADPSKESVLRHDGQPQCSFHTKEEVEGCKIDLYSANPVHYGAMLFTYTGSDSYVIGHRRIVKRMGEERGEELIMNECGVYKNGELVASETEEDLYRVMGRNWRPPEQRR